MSAPHGWYPEPGSGLIRWWDGYQWGPYAQAPVVRPKTSHAFHLIMTLLTLGLWAPVWVIVAIVNASKAPAATPYVPPQPR